MSEQPVNHYIHVAEEYQAVELSDIYTVEVK